MTYYKGNSIHNVQPHDKQQDKLRDQRHGAHDSGTPPIKTEPMQQFSTQHEAAQHCADVSQKLPRPTTVCPRA